MALELTSPARRLARHLVPAVAGACLVAAFALAPGARSAAAPRSGPDGPCPDSRGVTVVVDFQDQGRGVQVGCAPGSPEDGFAALLEAGFAVQGVVTQSGFVCRIDDYPGPAEELCIATPPATAYWSYWSADRGGPWTYSDVGAAARTPGQGTVEGWSFSRDGGVGDAPPPRSVTAWSTPSTTRAAKTTATTTTVAPAPTPAASIASATTVAPAAPAPAPTAPPTTDSPVGASSTVATTAPPTTSGATTTTEPLSPPEEATSTVELVDSGGSGPAPAVGTAVGIAVIGAVGAGAVVLNRRRFATGVAPGGSGGPAG